MPRLAIFHGDAETAYALMVAVEHNCSCDRDELGKVRGDCGAHRALLDQRFSDGVLFGRFLMRRLMAEEFRLNSN